MQLARSSRIRTMPALEDLYGVFRDGVHAGWLLADLVRAVAAPGAVVVAVAPQAHEVGAAMAAALHLPLELATAATIGVPWNSALWLGAVAFDGTVYLDPARLLDATLTRAEIDAVVEAGLKEAAGDEMRYRDGRPFAPLHGRPAILVDDGLSPCCVVRVVMSALENAGASRVVLALPTGKQYEVKRLAERAFRTYCANLHHDRGAQLARAYQSVDEATRQSARQAPRQPASLSPDKP